MWQQPNGAYRIGGSETERPVSNYGLYATGDQWLRKANKDGANTGPGFFFQLGWSPAARNSVHHYAGGGLCWAGVIPGRARDTVGVGVTSAWITGATHTDVVTEVFYKAHVNSRLFIQPDLQYARTPGGTGPNAILGGLRVGLEF